MSRAAAGTSSSRLHCLRFRGAFECVTRDTLFSARKQVRRSSDQRAGDRQTPGRQRPWSAREITTKLGSVARRPRWHPGCFVLRKTKGDHSYEKERAVYEYSFSIHGRDVGFGLPSAREHSV